jgi:hypothetical protein
VVGAPLPLALVALAERACFCLLCALFLALAGVSVSTLFIFALACSRHPKARNPSLTPRAQDIATTMLVLISCTEPSIAGSKSYMGLSFALGFAVCLSEAEYPLLALDDLIPLLAAKTTQKGVGALYARASLAIINNVVQFNVLGRRAPQVELSGIKRDLQKRRVWLGGEPENAAAAKAEATWLGKIMLGIDRIIAERAPREKAELEWVQLRAGRT